MANDRTSGDQQPSGWAIGGIVFAAVAIMLIGLFQVIAGLAAIIDDEFFIVTRNYTFDLDTSAWGWVHLLLGVLLLFASWGLVHWRDLGSGYGDLPGLAQCARNFFFIPYYPFWAILVIALDVWVIWSLTRPGVIEKT